MRHADVQIGKTYAAKVSGDVVPVRLLSLSPYGGWDAINVKTGRSVRIRTAARLRGRVEERDGRWVFAR